MASASPVKRSNSSSRTGLLCNDSGKTTKFPSNTAAKILKGETSICKDVEGLSISLAKTVSKKLKKNRNGIGIYNGNESVNKPPVSTGCFNLNMKGGGCRVVACEELDVYVRRSLSSMEDCLPNKKDNDAHGVGAESFSHGAPDMSGKNNLRKGKAIEPQPSSSVNSTSLPDDVMEMILAHLPLTSLMAARCVCKKWKYLTTSSHFVQMRCEGSCKSPWLFVFGLTRNGHHAGDIHALNISLDRWHKISNDYLRDRFLFSVATAGTDIYIVGGCSRLSLSTEISPMKNHKGVLVFNPFTGSWRKAAPMMSARSGPLLGVFEIHSNCSIFHVRPDRQDRSSIKSRIGTVSEIYEDPHRFSVRRRLRDAFIEDDDSRDITAEPFEFARSKMIKSSKFGLIVVGGRGCWDEPLDSGEIYDPRTDRWVEISNLPGDFGAVCTGAVCRQMFYVYSEADKLACYDIERGFWITIQTARPPPHIHEYQPKLVSCKGRLFLLSVSWCEREAQLNRREKAVRKQWELDFALPAWYEVSRHPDAPMDWNVAFVADDSRIYGVEMFSIFGQVLGFLTACHISDTELKWSRISRKHTAHEADAGSCMTKSMVALHL